MYGSHAFNLLDFQVFLAKQKYPLNTVYCEAYMRT